MPQEVLLAPLQAVAAERAGNRTGDKEDLAERLEPQVLTAQHSTFPVVVVFFPAMVAVEVEVALTLLAVMAVKALSVYGCLRE